MQNWHIYARGYSHDFVLGDRVREFNTLILFLLLLQIVINFTAYTSVMQTNLFNAQVSQIKQMPQKYDSNIILHGLEKDKIFINNVSLEIPDILPNEKRLWIPSLSINVPIMTAGDVLLEKGKLKEFESEIQSLLKTGVVEMPGSDFEGKISITGHSSYYPWDDGQYKTVFASLSKLRKDDDIYLFYDNKKHHYKVTEDKTVWPSEVNVLESEPGKKQVSLITCTPIGTNLKRYIVVAEMVE